MSMPYYCFISLNAASVIETEFIELLRHNVFCGPCSINLSGCASRHVFIPESPQRLKSSRDAAAESALPGIVFDRDDPSGCGSPVTDEFLIEWFYKSWINYGGMNTEFFKTGGSS